MKKKIQPIDKHFYRANGELLKDSNVKPDFVVYTISVNAKFILVLSEFKNATNYTAIESDKVKLGKQMRTVYNELVKQRYESRRLRYHLSGR